MKDAYIRQQLLQQQLRWSAERAALVKQAVAAEDYEEKDECYRKAAVLGIRLDSIAQVTRAIGEVNCTDIQRARAYQKHMRDMQRLKYTPRPPHLTQDGIDTEVISQFYTEGVVVNAPRKNAPKMLMH